MEKSLLERAIEIRDEVTESQNTAERVGGVLVEVVEKHTALEPRVDEVESRSDDMLRDVDRIDLLTEAIDENVTLLNKKNAQQATEIAALKSADTTLQQELANHQSTLNDHEQFLNEYREAIDEHDRKLSLLQSRYDEIQTHLDNIYARISALEKKTGIS